MSEAITPYPSGANSNGWARAARDALCELGRVDDIRQLGANGPLMASAGAESWFNCLFGRDALRIAADLLDDFPAVA